MIPSPACKERASSASEAYVYLLRSKTTGKFYVGWTTDIKRRIQEHNSGKSQYTKARGPWELIGCETYPNAEAAKKRERTFKRNPRMLFYFKKRALSSLQGLAASWRRASR
ncbi:MAG: GIY-YIG nuclease family protein [Candidatus Omnitrophica bacterium]|nr:GIY-YIG nuclease family protein [Candidatus Omnitrophota bacterium]